MKPPSPMKAFPGYQIVERQDSNGMTRGVSRREHFPVGFVKPFEANEGAFIMAIPPRSRRLVIELRNPDNPSPKPHAGGIVQTKAISTTNTIGLVSALSYLCLPTGTRVTDAL